MKNILHILVFLFCSGLAYAQPNPTETIHWSASKKLAWTDFIAKPDGKTGGFGQATMAVNARFKKGIKMKTTVETIFDKKKSFAEDDDKNPTMLKYYQTMFDLHEVASRKLRKQFSESKFGIDPERNFLQELYKAALADLEKENDRYMEETDFGEITLRPWTNGLKIQSELKALEKFQEY